jgi:hypothetical protein
MPSWEDRYEQAHRHVTNGLYVIERQRILIERQKSLSADTKRSEELLSQFERSQVIFEEDLDRIILERD